MGLIYTKLLHILLLSKYACCALMRRLYAGLVYLCESSKEVHMNYLLVGHWSNPLNWREYEVSHQSGVFAEINNVSYIFWNYISYKTTNPPFKNKNKYVIIETLNTIPYPGLNIKLNLVSKLINCYQLSSYFRIHFMNQYKRFWNINQHGGKYYRIT